MENAVRDAVQKHFHCAAEAITPLGGGFYGRVFLAEIPRAPKKVVYKLYLFPGIARREALQLRTLKRYATLAVPEPYFAEEAQKEGDYDLMAMEYLPGVNAGCVHVSDLPSAARERIANGIVDNLLSLHQAENAKGFGELDDAVFFPDFRDLYRPAAENTVRKARALCDKGDLNADAADAFARACARFSAIFSAPIPRAHLIHGDYNTWNILLSDDLSRAQAMIDPFGCRWADSEYDLYQLDNANGKAYGLLSLYGKKRALSENFQIKKLFYEAFTELNHFYDAGIDLKKSDIPRQAKALTDEMRALGL